MFITTSTFSIGCNALHLSYALIFFEILITVIPYYLFSFAKNSNKMKNLMKIFVLSKAPSDMPRQCMALNVMTSLARAYRRKTLG